MEDFRLSNAAHRDASPEGTAATTAHPGKNKLPAGPTRTPTGDQVFADLLSPSVTHPADRHLPRGPAANNEPHGLPTSEGPWRRHHLSKTDLALAVVMLATALLVRWPFIARGETLLHSDEAIVGLMAQDIAEGRSLPLYFYGQRYMGALEAYAIAAVSPLFDDPIHALRFGPACFFALLVAVQYLMLTRWFGRRGGLMGALALLAAAPMLTQWSISARGGYIEIILWGSALIWAYSEWFVEPLPPRRRQVQRFVFGAILGSGWWINPSILMFVLPIAAHALLNRPLAAVLAIPGLGTRLKRAASRTGVATLPALFILALLLLNVTWSVWVEPGRVRKVLLLGLVPQPIAAGILATIAVAAIALAVVKTNVVGRARQLLQTNGMMILGMLAGAAPAALYVLQTVTGSRPMDPSLPLGLRPLWLAGDTMLYLIHGLPLLLGADPRPFLQLVSVGRDTATLPLGLMTSGIVSAANWLVLGALLTSLVILLLSYQESIRRVLRLQPGNHPAAILLMLGFGGCLALYVMGGCALDFTTIRYMVPFWAFVPGLLAAAFVSRRFRLAVRLAPLWACAAWSVGQWAMYQQLGSPHPLRRVANVITTRGIDPAIAEPLDAHLLTYLTQQRCRTAEFESFWPRLGHFRPLVETAGPTDYIVQTREIDRVQDWISGHWPGRSPPETTRFLWPRLRLALINQPASAVSREPLADGYERIRLGRPLPERTGGSQAR